MNKTISFLLVLSTFLSLSAQDTNLVYNWSFEEYNDCPESYILMNNSHILIPEWTYPTFATPDYFNRCSRTVDMVGVPKNFAGISEPKTGDAYVGAILTGDKAKGKANIDYREYIQGHLKTPMEEGIKYCITYYFKLASFSQFCVDQQSMYFSNDPVLTDGKKSLPFKPQINNKSGLFLDESDEWQRVCNVYTAQGGEEYFIVGNFKDYSKTNYVITDKNALNKQDKRYAYYYFDDFVIRELEDCNDCPCVLHDFEAAIIDTFYTGGKDPVTDEIKEIKNDGRIKLTAMGGTPPYQVDWSNGAKGMYLNNLPGGTYTYVARDSFNCLASGTVIFIQPEIPEDEFLEGLQAIEEGEAIVLENIFFEYNKTALLEESHKELDKVVAFMKKNNISLVEISGHTDSDGSEQYNQKLSEGRAKSVVEYLTEKGISESKLEAVGYGEVKPIETNQTDEGKAINRRVEFRILKK